MAHNKLDIADGTCIHFPFRFLNELGIVPAVWNHELHILSIGFLYEFSGFIGFRGKRFLAQDVESAFQCGKRMLIVECMGACDDDSL